MARDLIEIMEEVEAGTFTVDVSIEVPAEAKSHWERSKHLHELADALKSEAAAEAHEAAQFLVGMGLTLREVGTSLGVSFQRAGQLADAKYSGWLAERRNESVTLAQRYLTCYPETVWALTKGLSDPSGIAPVGSASMIFETLSAPLAEGAELRLASRRGSEQQAARKSDHIFGEVPRRVRG